MEHDLHLKQKAIILTQYNVFSAIVSFVVKGPIYGLKCKVKCKA